MELIGLIQHQCIRHFLSGGEVDKAEWMHRRYRYLARRSVVWYITAS